MVQVQALSMQQRAAPFVGDATIHLLLHACAGACGRAQSLYEYDVWARELSVVVSSLADKCVPMLQHFDPTPTESRLCMGAMPRSRRRTSRPTKPAIFGGAAIIN